MGYITFPLSVHQLVDQHFIHLRPQEGFLLVYSTRSSTGVRNPQTDS